MTKITIREFVWDEINLEHIKTHNISKEEIEQAKEIIYHRRTYGGKYLMTARSGKRFLTIIISRKGISRYYVVTARDSSKKERKQINEKEHKK